MKAKRTSAALAVTAFGLAVGAASASAADTVPCGTPAVDAVYRTVVTPAVPEVSHLEYLWTRETTTYELQWQRWVVDTAAQPAVYGTVTHPAVYETVVVTPAQPAWDEEVEQPLGYDLYEFQHTSGKTRWEPDPNWNSNTNQNSNGWTATGASKPATETVTIHHEAVPEVTEQRLVTPEWEEQVLVSPAVEEEGHFDRQWSQTSPGAGWEETGERRPVGTELEEQWAAASPGSGWVQSGQERRVVDQSAVPESSEQVLVSPAVPAGPPCPVEEPVDPVEEPVDPVDEPADPVDEPADPVVEPAPKPKPASAVPQVGTVTKPAATVNAAPQQLAHTGADLTLMWIGLGTLLAGIGVSAGYRKTLRLG